MIDFLGPSLESTGISAARNIRRALRLLLDAKEYAKRTQSGIWEFAVAIDLLYGIGLTDIDLRYLVRARHLEHAQDITAIGQMERKLRVVQSVIFDQRSCFILTARGARLASQLMVQSKLRVAHGLSSKLRPIRPDHPMERARRLDATGACDLAIDPLDSPRSEMDGSSASNSTGRPVWNAATRTLSCNGKVVKCFRRRAANQERVLGAFQEDSWPLRIDDPLAPQPCQDIKRRLNDTIKCLNRGHQFNLLRFRGDGTGEGVIWEIVG